MTDLVNHPPHYTSHPSGVECIQVTESMSFCLGNAVKYLWRHGDKGTAAQDLDKARWYVERALDMSTRGVLARTRVSASAIASLHAWLNHEPPSAVRTAVEVIFRADTNTTPSGFLLRALVEIDRAIADRKAAAQ